MLFYTTAMMTSKWDCNGQKEFGTGNSQFWLFRLLPDVPSIRIRWQMYASFPMSIPYHMMNRNSTNRRMWRWPRAWECCEKTPLWSVFWIKKMTWQCIRFRRKKSNSRLVISHPHCICAAQMKTHQTGCFWPTLLKQVRAWMRNSKHPIQIMRDATKW